MATTDLKPIITLGKLAGSWRLIAADQEDKATGTHAPMFGPSPRGRIVALSNGVVMALLIPDGRRSPSSQEESAMAFQSMVAYSGRFKVNGDEGVTVVDIAWNEDWIGTTQTRKIELLGPDKIRLATPWMPSPFDATKTMRGILDWERET